MPGHDEEILMNRIICATIAVPAVALVGLVPQVKLIVRMLRS